MPLTTRLVSEVATWMGLVPLAWLVLLHARGQVRDRAFWLLALAFAVSWVADMAALALQGNERRALSLVYPISQATIVGAVFLTRADAMRFAVVLIAAGAGAMVWRGPRELDLLVRSIAMLGVTGIVVDRWALGALRTSLLVYFGLGWALWLAYTAQPGWWTWSAYQLARAAGLVLFCRACARPVAELRAV